MCEKRAKMRISAFCYDRILIIEKIKSKLEVTLEGAANRIEFGCVLTELFVIRHVLVKTLRIFEIP